MKKKRLIFPSSKSCAVAVKAKGKDREVVNPELSDRALAKIERYERMHRQAAAELGKNRVG